MKTINRNAAYEMFRKFYKDDKQEGDSLLSVAPMRYNATRMLGSRRGSLTRLAYKTGVKIAATSLLVPTELCWAAGYTPFNWELYASLLASHSAINDLTGKGSVTSPRCSFINTLKGAYLESILPEPDLTISSGAYCEGISYSVEELSMGFGSRHFHLDIPAYLSNQTSGTLAQHLREVYFEIASMNGLTPGEAESRLRQTMLVSNQSRKIYQEIWDLRKKHGPLNMGLEPLHWHYQFMPLWGDESGLRIIKQLKAEIEADLPNLLEKKGGIPVGVFGLIPYGRTELWRRLLDNDAYFAFEGVNYIGEYEILPDVAVEDGPIGAIFENMAINLINTPIRGGNMTKKGRQFMEEAAEMGTAGMIIFSHEHCQMLCPRLTILESEANLASMQVVSISGDCILGMPPGPAGIRLGTFLNGLKERNGGLRNEELPTDHAQVVANTPNVKALRLGVDFGSGYSKYVLLNDKTEIVQHGLFSSGIDYANLLSEIKKEIAVDEPYLLALAGVGGDHPNMKKISHLQTTEISALIRAVRQLFATRSNLLVVDIGTQDVKVLKFAKMNDTPWVNTNKSCGAGTGLVLAQILERWRQSKPEMTFTMLDEMAQNATKAEMINTTCGIFAVTNVVSALVQADSQRRCEILKGVYQYIAAQAIRLLPVDDQKGGEMFLTGGIASHKSLKQVFTQKGFTLLEVPSFLNPQHLVAYGTALSLSHT
ncbi:MAG: BadF/BadG/BcrA/BcrD ATPase family protein [Breznakibacter sp.]